MQGKHVLRHEGSVEEQAFEQRSERAAGEDAELRRSVEQEIQGKVDINHPDAGRTGLTLEAEEKLAAREWEIERTHRRWDSRQESSREARTRRRAGAGSAERRREFERRRAGVDRWADPDQEDPRAELTKEELATVNQQAKRVDEQTTGMTRAAISRKLAERIVAGMDVLDAVVEVIELVRDAPGTVVPIAQVGEVDRGEVSVEGTVKKLWDPSHHSIQQVGLIEDNSGICKITVWKASSQPKFCEGDQIRIRHAAKNWYQGRVSLALTGYSRIVFSERRR